MSVGSKKTVRSFAWSAIEGGGLSLISFISLVAFSRILTPVDFGLFATVLSIVELVSLITNLTFQDALIQVPVITQAHKNTAFTVTVITAFAFSCAAWLVAPLFSALMHDPKAGLMLGLLGGNFFLAGVSATLTAQQRREFQFKTLALRSLIGRVSGAVIGIAAGLLGAGVWSLVIQQMCIAGLSSLVLWIASDDRPRFGFDRIAFRELFFFGVAAAGAEFVSSGLKRLFAAMCGVLLGVSAAGYINIAFRVVDTLWNVSAQAMYQVMLPVMSRLQSDRAGLQNVYRQGETMACAVLYAVFMGLAATAPRVVPILFGRIWLPAAPFVVILCAMMLFQIPRIFAVPVLTALGRPKDVLIGYLFGFLYLAIVLLLRPFQTSQAALWVWFGTELVYAPVFAFLLYRASGISVTNQAKYPLTPLIASLIMFAAVRGFDRIFLKNVHDIPALIACCTFGAFIFTISLIIVDRPLLMRLIDQLRAFLGRHRPESDADMFQNS